MSEVNGRAIFGSPKTHADRWVAVPRFMRDDVAVLMAGRSPDDLLFTSQRGEVLRVHGFRRRSFDRAATASGVPGLVPHELRHTAASLAIAAGANVKAVQIMLGHVSAAMTLDRYSHLFDEAMAAVPTAWTRPASGLLCPPRAPRAW
jgi:integrase